MKKILLILLITTIVFAAKSRKTQDKKWTTDDLHFYGMLAGGFVSLIGFIASFLLLFLQKFISARFYTTIIQVLFAFSCGALLGETMLHILPEAYASPLLQDRQVSLTFIGAILSFLLIERIMQKVGVSDSHWTEDDALTSNKKNQHPRVIEKNKELMENSKKANKSKELEVPKHSTGYLNLFSSLLHNFIDGAAIGVAFSLGNPKQFIPVTVGIIAHQIPREMGDVAILLKSNFNAKQTILSNGIVNLISLVGVWIGLNSHGIPDVIKQYILVFVAGNFLYIASDIWKHIFHNKGWSVNFLEIAGLAVGVWLTLEDHSHSH